MESKRVLFISEEITPYLPETSKSNLSRYLPQGIQERGKEVRTFIPKYGIINERRNQLHEVIRLSGMNIIINDNDHPLIIKVASIQAARMQIYFIDNEDFFQKRLMFRDENGEEYSDNAERSIFFIRGTLETVKKLRWVPDVIHCHGWFSVIAAVLVKKMYAEDPCFKNSKIVLSLYNDDFEKPFCDQFVDWLQIDNNDEKIASFVGKEITFESLYKMALNFSDGLIEGSAELNPEIVNYAKSMNVPYLSYQSEDEYVNAYNEFYDRILEEKK